MTTIDRFLEDLSLPIRVNMTPDELLLIDWAISAASRLLPDADDMATYMTWAPLRREVWRKLQLGLFYREGEYRDYLALEDKFKYIGRPVEITQSDARALLAILPCTFKWGTGPDCGFSLKAKLWQFIEGVYRDPRHEDEAQTPDATLPEDKPQP